MIFITYLISEAVARFNCIIFVEFALICCLSPFKNSGYDNIEAHLRGLLWLEYYKKE